MLECVRHGPDVGYGGILQNGGKPPLRFLLSLLLRRAIQNVEGFPDVGHGRALKVVRWAFVPGSFFPARGKRGCIPPSFAASFNFIRARRSRSRCRRLRAMVLSVSRRALRTPSYTPEVILLLDNEGARLYLSVEGSLSIFLSPPLLLQDVVSIHFRRRRCNTHTSNPDVFFLRSGPRTS